MVMQLMLTKALDLELEGPWLTVWFNQPLTKNPITEARAAELISLCEVLENRRDIRGVTFRGRGGVFCGGGDIKAFKTMFADGGNQEEILQMSRDAGHLLDAITCRNLRSWQWRGQPLAAASGWPVPAMW